MDSKATRDMMQDSASWTGNDAVITENDMAAAAGPEQYFFRRPPWITESANWNGISYRPVTAMTSNQIVPETQTTSSTVIRDTFSIFGEQVAAEMRNLPTPLERFAVQQRIQTILFEAANASAPNFNCFPAVFVPPCNNNSYEHPVQKFGSPTVILDNSIHNNYTTNLIPVMNQSGYTVNAI